MNTPPKTTRKFPKVDKYGQRVADFTYKKEKELKS
jgi:hypothetical protein